MTAVYWFKDKHLEKMYNQVTDLKWELYRIMYKLPYAMHMRLLSFGRIENRGLNKFFDHRPSIVEMQDAARDYVFDHDPDDYFLESQQAVLVQLTSPYLPNILEHKVHVNTEAMRGT